MPTTKFANTLAYIFRVGEIEREEVKEFISQFITIVICGSLGGILGMFLGKYVINRRLRGK
jgi:hypothetical protein